MKKAVLILIILAAGIGVGVAAGIVWGQGERLDLRRAEEAARADAAGLRVAVETTQRKLEQRAAEVVELTEQIDAVRAVAPSVEVRETVRWRTERIDVPYETLVPGATEYVEGNCVIPELPEISFDVRGTEARVESDAKNLFAVGSVQLYRVAPPPEVLLGTAPWRADLTELARVAPRRSPWRLSLAVWGSTQADVGLGLNWQSRRRWGLTGGWMTSDGGDRCEYVPQIEAYSCSAGRRSAVYAGVTFQVWPWRR